MTIDLRSPSYVHAVTQQLNLSILRIYKYKKK